MIKIPERAETLLVKLDEVGYSRAAEAIRNVWSSKDADLFFSDLLSYTPNKEFTIVDDDMVGVIKNRAGFSTEAFFLINEISDIHDEEEEKYRKTLTRQQKNELKSSVDIWKEAYVPRKKR